MRFGEMKKRKQIVENEKAVSAVIAVMLMVAMAVAMAAVAYAYLTGMVGGDNLEAAPIIDFTADYNENTLLITYSEVDIDWEDFRIIGTDGSNTEVLQSDTEGKTGTASVGEKIDIDDGSIVAGTVTVTITHIPSETLMGEYTFKDVV